jgi:hypothetical protein
VKRALPILQASSLPPLYAAWMDECLPGPIPQETEATCDDCAMCADKEDQSSQFFFNPQTKCCTYIPVLPNYLVGRIIADEDTTFAKGRDSVLERLCRGVNVTPLGLGQPPDFEVLYGQSSASLFGQSRTLRCPHYLENEGGRCGIWKHRASICATWYCKHVRGEVGFVFWKTLYQLLLEVEKTLARWCVLELEIGADALRALFPFPSPGLAKNIDARALDGLPDRAKAEKLWGNWAGRVEDFYRQCARLAEALDWHEVMTIGGTELRVTTALLHDAYDKLISKEIPTRLKVGSIRIIGMDQDSCSIATYSSYDPVNVPKCLVEALGYFEGRSVAEALQAIAANQNVNVSRALVRKLTDFGILVPV